MKVFVSLTVLAIVGTATALECFTCNSGIDSACSDEFHFDSPALLEKFMKPCNNKTDEEGNPLEEGAPFCRKIKTYIERVKKPQTIRVSRDCGYRRRKDYPCYQKRAEDYIMNTCQCDGERCNGAPALTTSVASVVALTIPFFTRFL